MNLADRLAAIEGVANNEEVSKAKQPPTGWQAGVTWHGSHGELTTGTVNEQPSEWDDILRARGLDPDVFEVVSDTMKWCSWDGWTKTPDGETEPTICYSFKAEIRRKRLPEEVDTSLEELYKSTIKLKPKKIKHTGSSTFVVALSDWQTGNRDGGGIQAQAAAVAELVESIPDRISALRKTGHDIGHILVLGMGDLVEGCSGHYPAQPFRIELDRRDQVKFVRRGIRDILVALAPMAPEISVVAIPGNHGENRQNGKSITSVHDNDDVAVFEQVAEILAMNPDAFGHIGFRLSRDEIALGISVSDHIVSATHGHVTKPGANAAQALWTWWEKQSMGRAYPCVADADILVAGHYHHLNVKEQQNRALFICPSLTPVGEYFADSQGVRTRCGTLSFLVSPDGWGELTLL